MGLLFDAQLQKLNSEMIIMGSMIEQAIKTAGELLISRDQDTAMALKRGDSEIDRKEREIESLCMRMLLIQQPVARDLRVISSTLKMITDMERIADQASDIAEILTMPLHGAAIPFPEQLQHMARETALMVNRAIDAYVKRDADLASEVIAHDDVVDGLFTQVKENIVALINEDHTKDSMQLLDMLMIAKYFERSADHAVNIAEWVEYAVSGLYKGERLQ